MVSRNRKGQFKPGNNEWTRRGDKKAQAEAITCPPSLKADGMEPIWRALARRAVRGDKDAQTQLVRLYKQSQTVKPEPIAVEALPTAQPAGVSALPGSTQELLDDLALEIAYVVRRYEMGMPCHDVEILLAETHIACQEGSEQGRKRRGHIAAILTDMLAEARAQAVHDPVPGPTPAPAGETDGDKRQRLLDGELVRLRHRSQAKDDATHLEGTTAHHAADHATIGAESAVRSSPDGTGTRQ